MEPNLPDDGPGPHGAQRELDYKAVFRAGVTPYVLITPELVVADVNDAYLALAGRSREELVGSDLFTAFPTDTGGEVGAEGAASLRASLLEVVRSGKPDVMDMQHYPLLDARTGSFQVRYFTAINIPVLDGCGAVAWILHRVEEATESLSPAAPPLPAETDTAAPALYTRTRELVRRNRKLALQASHDREVSRILQEAMLTELPEPGDLHYTARYVANTAADQVGGDWYDAAVLPSGATMIAVGDVVGHDITAAASMGQLRGLLRAVAWDREEAPAAILTRVDSAMPGLKLDTLATAILGRIEQAEAEGVRRLCWSNAGHPPPLLLSEDGTVGILETGNDLPLGAGFGLPRHDHVHELKAGSILILYTDGLVERRDRPRDEGIVQLADALRHHHQLPFERLIDQVILDVAGNAPEDDIAVLAILLVPLRSAPAAVAAPDQRSRQQQDGGDA
jgi:serine phosphatase RsbU (regulator of sigma subunit)